MIFPFSFYIGDFSINSLVLLFVFIFIIAILFASLNSSKKKEREEAEERLKSQREEEERTRYEQYKEYEAFRNYQRMHGSASGASSGSSMADDYKILGLNENASVNEIKAAYKKLAKDFHPDKYANSNDEIRRFAEEKFKKINSAYSKICKARGIK